jgi:hypothetical protein
MKAHSHSYRNHIVCNGRGLLHFLKNVYEKTFEYFVHQLQKPEERLNI